MKGFIIGFIIAACIATIIIFSLPSPEQIIQTEVVEKIVIIDGAYGREDFVNEFVKRFNTYNPYREITYMCGQRAAALSNLANSLGICMTVEYGKETNESLVGHAWVEDCVTGEVYFKNNKSYPIELNENTIRRLNEEYKVEGAK